MLSSGSPSWYRPPKLPESRRFRRGVGQHERSAARLCGIRHSLKFTKECYGDGSGILNAISENGGPPLATECAEAHTDRYINHKVREGDTLTLIAKKYNVTVQSIAYLNKIADVDYIPSGELLLIPIERLKSGEVLANADGSSCSMESQGPETKTMVFQTESSLSRMPYFVSSISFQSCYVRLALLVVLLFPISTFLRRCVSDLRTRSHENVLRYEVEKEVQDAHQRPKLKRWQGILDDDRRIDEVDRDLLADGRTVLDVEEEKLRQSYADLETAYVKFLADSGLSKSGYWRGGMPSALEEQ